MASTRNPSSTRLDPSIRYYIHRKHGNAIVPLIPADQLPFTLKDFPQNMDHRQLSEGGWKFLNETPEIPIPLPLLSPHIDAPLVSRPAKSPAVLESVATGGRKDVARSGPAEATVKTLTDSMAAIYTNDARRIGYNKHSATGASTGLAKRREYCRRWIKTGKCAFTTQGCWHVHEMPSLNRLKDMGIQSIPQWYQEKDKDVEDGPGKKAQSQEVAVKAPRAMLKLSAEQRADVCGVYTTNTVDEPMLMDVHDPTQDARGSPTPMVVESPSAVSVPAPNPTEALTSIALPSTSPVLSASTPVPTRSQDLTAKPVESALNPSNGPTQTQTPTQTPTPKSKHPKKPQTSLTPKTPASRNEDDEAAKITKLLTKHKVPHRKGWKLRIRQPVAPGKKPGASATKEGGAKAAGAAKVSSVAGVKV